MGLELKKGRDGQLVMTWYGRYSDCGRRVSVALCSVEGTPPPSMSIRDTGDADFEKSREIAEGLLSRHEKDASQKGHAAHLTERLIEAKTGRKVEYVKLSDLPAKWRGLGRESQPTASWLAWCDTVFKRFAESVPSEFLHEVTPDQVSAYVAGLRADFTRRTANGAASLLKSAFARLLPPGASNPFGNEIARKREEAEGDSVHRRPLTEPELITLFATARPDPFLYPLTVCAACTGLRIGDVCQLAWKSVDLRAGVVAVRTAKTGASVEIPIFKPLREVLETALADKGESLYVWPEAARMYTKNRYGITYRGKSLFARALIDTTKDAPEATALASEHADLAETLPDVLEAIRSAGFPTAKCARILDTLTRYAEGQSYRQIEAETGRQRGQTSEDLHEAEKVTRLSLRQGATIKSGRAVKELIGATRQKRWSGDKRENGEKRLSASLLGWHALRGTWATLALSAGIPIETVKLVTGHGTTNTILKYYYNPQRGHLRTVLGDRMPDVLTGGKATKGKRKHPVALPAADPMASVVAQLQAMTAEQRAQLAAMLKA